MFEHLKKLITTHDLDTLFSFCSNLADNERLALLEEFQQSKWGLKESFWDKGMFELQPPNDSNYEFIMALFLLTRSVEEYQALSIHKICGYYVSSSHFFNNSKALHILPKILREEKYRFILDFYRALKPNEKEFISFETYWALYKVGEIPFDKALFTKNITATYLYDDKKVRYTDLVLHDQEFHDKIFRRLHLYENQMFHDAKPWEDFFVHLQRQGYVFDRKYIPELLESLLNPWKKPHLNWHCRWIEFLEPTTNELLACQQPLFALLSTGNTNLINFALKHIQQIAEEKDFDFQSFADNFALCFTTQKIAKSQLIGLNILEKHYKQQAPTNPDYREQLAVLFTVPDVKLQEKVAALLTTYFNHEGLSEVIAPYRDYLKGKAQDLLATLSPSENSENSPTACAARTLTPITYPLKPEDLLFLLGDCLREPAAHTIDVFLEGLITLQDDFSADWAKSLSPYIKQLTKRVDKEEIPTDAILLGVLRALIDQCPLALDPKCRYTWEEFCQKREKLSEKELEAYSLDYYLDKARQVLPFLFRKGQIVIDAILQHCHQPLLSTPTHLPFYIEAEVLVDKLLQYEAQGKSPDLDDLIVACNRLLFKEVSVATKEKARQLKGVYAPAIQYYLGLTDEIQLTDELLPLWAQITRLKHPDRAFPEFATTSAKDILGVGKPYLIGYGWQENKSHKKFVFEHHTKWIRVSYTDLKNAFPYRYYNANGGSSPISTIFEYKISLNPHYPDAMLCDYISTWVTRNEVREIRNMSLPLEVLLRYNISLRHSGWLYIGTALLFEKRPSRDLAYEYLCQTIACEEDLSYLRTYLAQVLAWDFLPIPRFIEFLDRPNPPAVKAFGKEVVALYLEEVKKQDKLPKNHKKMMSYDT